MEKSVKLPEYSRSLSTYKESFENVITEYELQYDKDHNVEKVEVGEVDIFKEVQSHANEVGLVNVVKNAIAHGEDPLTKFSRVDEGRPIMKSIDPNTTFDELQEMISFDDKKYADIAASLGLSSEQLKAAINDGSIGSIIEAAAKVEEKKEGEE